MKKFLIVALVALFGASAANAQLVKSRTYTETEKKSNTMWFLRVGMAMNNYTQTDDFEPDGIGSKIGYDFSVGFHKPIADFGMYWGMEFGLGTRGYKQSLDEKGYSYSESTLAHNVKISPITFGYKYAVTDWLKIDAHLGAYLSYDYAGKYKWEYDDDQYSEDGDESVYDAFDDYFGFDAGIQAGIGLWFDRFNLDFTYQRGFMGIYDISDFDSPRSSNFMIRLGVAF